MAKGRYEKWLTPEGLTLIEGWKRNGLSDEQIAKNMGVRRETLYVWANSYPNISNALKKGREVVIAEIENALVKRARGYSYTEETQELRFNRQTGQHELVTVKRLEKQVPPDVGAIAFYLKNVAPDKWRDRQDVAVSAQTEDIRVLADTLKQLGMDEEGRT